MDPLGARSQGVSGLLGGVSLELMQGPGSLGCWFDSGRPGMFGKVAKSLNLGTKTCSLHVKGKVYVYSL